MYKKDCYDLELEINNCWNITKDLNDYLWRMFDSPEGILSEDDQMNILLGIVSTYNMKFEKLMDMHCQVFGLNCYHTPYHGNNGLVRDAS